MSVCILLIGLVKDLWICVIEKILLIFVGIFFRKSSKLRVKY